MNLPAAQSRHTVIPAYEYAPAGQSVQKLELGNPCPVPYFPVKQLAHVTPALAPDAVEYVPCWQFWQAEDRLAPVPVWYVPAWQEAHWLLLETAWPVE